jgi:hypothetical protein
VSLSDELNLILEALEGVQLLAKLQAEHHFVGKERQRATRATAASLILLRERLQLLDRAVGGFVDPRELLMPENRAVGADEEGDLRLPTWGTKRTMAHHKRELERAERRAQSVRQIKPA